MESNLDAKVEKSNEILTMKFNQNSASLGQNFSDYITNLEEKLAVELFNFGLSYGQILGDLNVTLHKGMQENLENLSEKFDRQKEETRENFISFEAKFDQNFNFTEKNFNEKIQTLKENLGKNVTSLKNTVEKLDLIEIGENFNATERKFIAMEQKIEENFKANEEKMETNSKNLEFNLNSRIEKYNENLADNLKTDLISPLEKSFNDELILLKDNFVSKTNEKIKNVEKDLNSHNQIIEILIQNNKLKLDEMDRIEKIQSERISGIEEALKRQSEIISEIRKVLS